MVPCPALRAQDFSPAAAQRVLAVARLCWLGLVGAETRQKLSALLLAVRTGGSRLLAEVFAETARRVCCALPVNLRGVKCGDAAATGPPPSTRP